MAESDIIAKQWNIYAARLENDPFIKPWQLEQMRHLFFGGCHFLFTVFVDFEKRSAKDAHETLTALEKELRAYSIAWNARKDRGAANDSH